MKPVQSLRCIGAIGLIHAMVSNRTACIRRVCRSAFTTEAIVLWLFAGQGGLFLCQYFRLLPKGWPVLFALGGVGLALLAIAGRFLLGLVFHWRFQFSMRFLFLLLGIAAISCSWFACERAQAKRQWEFATKTCDAGCIYDVPSLDTPVFLRELFGEDFFCDLIGVWSDDVGAGISLDYLFSAAPRVDFLAVAESRLTDADLERLTMYKDLWFLDLRETPITDRGLEYVKSFKHLQRLYLSRERFSEEALASLRRALPGCKISYEELLPTP